MRLRRPIASLVLGLLVLLLLSAGPALAQAPPLDDTALVDQYKETIPTASGPKLSGGDSSGGGTPLPPAVVTELTQAVGEEEAKQLEEVATSPRYGAPHQPDEGGLAVSSETPGALSAAVGALVDEGGGSLLPLLLALVFATGALFGAAVLRRRDRGLTP